MKNINKFIISFSFLSLIILFLIPSVFAGTCGGSLPAGTRVNDQDSCSSCHVNTIPVYQTNVFDFKTEEVIEYYMICASDIFTGWDNFWGNDDEFSKKYPTVESYENMIKDIATEQAPIELDSLIYEEKKSKLNEAILLAWGLNVAIIKLVIELLLILLYIVEVLFLIFIFLVVIPHFFFGLRDSIVKNYLNRRL